MESMTGFGKASGEAEGLRLTATVRGVNNKGLDIRISLPMPLWSREAACRDRIRALFKRGRVDVSVQLEFIGESALEVSLSKTVAAGLGSAARSMTEDGVLSRGLTFTDLMAVPDAVNVGLSPAFEEAAASLLAETLERALAAFLGSRREEGERLARQFQEGAEALATSVAASRELVPKQEAELRGRLDERLSGMGDRLDEQRFEEEVLILLEKADVEEEIVRLESHVEGLRRILPKDSGNQGRRLDHLFQEMQREVSTLLAKSRLLELTRQGMEIRLVVEQLREQVQNVA